MAKRRRGVPDGPHSHGHGHGATEQEQEQRLYLILDDDPWGYSIREISLSPPAPSSSRQTPSSSSSFSTNNTTLVRRLPQPIISLEARRGNPLTFAAIGTKIVMTQYLNPHGTGNLLIPIYDVRRRRVTFGPGKFAQDTPIYFPVSNELFNLDGVSLYKLSLEPRQPPPLDYRQHNDDVPWSWHRLPPLPFHRVDVTSYAVLPDGQTILVSTDVYPGDPCSAAETFTFDAGKNEWKKHGDWTLPFAGRAHFVRCLQAFVALSKDPATLGHLVVSGDDVVTRPDAAWKLGKEKLFSDDPAETHVSATLVYMGSGGGGSEFCLVQCVSVKPGNGNGNDNADDENIKEHGNGNGNGNNADDENLEERGNGNVNGNADDKNIEEPRPSCCYRYRLTTFSLRYDDDGDLTTGETSWVQCYEVPRETTQRFIDRGDPVAFWL